MTAYVPLGRTFDAVPDDYDDVRPAYPDALYDALESVVGPLAGRRVLDLAAGTGIATRQLRRRNARVVAVDPGLPLLRRLRTAGDAPAVAAVAERLPLRDGCVDLACCATAWHWLDAGAVVQELRRVVRPGGHLAVWWANHRRDDAIGWEAAQGAVQDRWRLAVGSRPPTEVGVTPRDAAADLRARGLEVVLDTEFTWSRTVPTATHVRVLGTHSDVLALGPDRDRLLAEVATALAPWPEVTERLWGPLVVARLDRPDVI